MNDHIAEARNNFMNRTFGLVATTESLDDSKTDIPNQGNLP